MLFIIKSFACTLAACSGLSCKTSLQYIMSSPPPSLAPFNLGPNTPSIRGTELWIALWRHFQQTQTAEAA